MSQLSNVPAPCGPMNLPIPEYIRTMSPYRPGKPLEELKEEYGFERIIKLASNENPFGASPKALVAVQRTLIENARYPDPVSRKLRRAIAGRLNIAPEGIIVGAGSESLLAITIRALIQPGQVALTPYGAFMGFAIHLTAAGGKLVQVPAPDYRFDLKAVADALTPDTRIVYLPNPNNPTGSYFTHAELARFLEAVPATTLVLLDEAYIEYCGHLPDYPRALPLQHDNVLVLRTFSKAYGLAGFRIGYGVGHPALITELNKVKLTFEPSLSAQAAALAAWDDTEFLQRGIENNRQELERYYRVLERLGLRYVPSSGNFVFIECPSQGYANALNEALLQRGIAIRPLAAFGFPEAVRISVGLPEENDALFEALQAVLPALSQ